MKKKEGCLFMNFSYILRCFEKKKNLSLKKKFLFDIRDIEYHHI